MIRRLLLPVAIASSLVLSGCYTIRMEADSSYPLLLNQSKGRKGYFQNQERVYYYLFGLINSNPNVVDNMLRSHKTSAVYTINVSSQEDLIGVVTGAVTLGLLSSKVVRVEGHEE